MNHHVALTFAIITLIAPVFCLNYDFRVTAGTVVLGATEGSKILVAGSDYPTPSGPAFARIVNTRHMMMGRTSGGGSSVVNLFCAKIDQSNIGTSFTVSRAGLDSDAYRFTWEVLEYIGFPGKPNEFKVRDLGTIGFDPVSLTMNTAAVSGVEDHSKIVPFVVGQYSTQSSLTVMNTIQATASWNSGSSLATFTRGAIGAGSYISYVIVEFTGSNWVIQRTEHTLTAASTLETETLTSSLGFLNKAFLHVQHRQTANSVQEGGSAVYPVSTSQIGFWTYDLPTGGIVDVAWVMENTAVADTHVIAMNTQHIYAERTTGGTEEDTWQDTVTSVAVLNTTSIFGQSASSHGPAIKTLWPRGSIDIRLVSQTAVELKRSDNGKDQTYAYTVVEWPSFCTAGTDCVGVCGGGAEPSDPTQCFIDHNDLAVTAGVNARVHVYSRVADGSNQTRSYDNYTVTFTPTDASVVNLGSGAFGVDFNETTAGEYQLDIQLSTTCVDSVIPTSIAGSPYTVVVSPGPTAIHRCISYGYTAIAGTSSDYWLQAVDTWGNNRTTDDGITVTASIGPLEVTGVYDTDGLYRLNYNLTTAGTHTVTVRVNGIPTSDSPHTLLVTAATTSPSHSVASGPGLTGTLAGETGTFTIQMVDSFGNNVTDNDIFDVAFTGASLYSTTSVFLGDGLSRVDYNITVAGEYSMAVTLSGMHIVGSPFYVAVVPHTASDQCQASGAALNSVTAGVIGSIWIQSRDSFGNNITIGSGNTYAVTLNGAHITQYYEGSGINRIDYNVTKAGVYSLDIVLGSDPVTGSPFSVTVSPQATTIGWRSTATGTGLNSATAGVIGTFWIQSKDVFGNNRTIGVADTFDVQFTGPSSVATTSFDTVNGIDRVDYNVTVSGDYSMSVTYGGVHISGSPFSVTVVAHTVTAQWLTTASGTGLNSATAGVFGTFWIQPRDTYGNNRTIGVTDTFDVQFTGPSSVATASFDTVNGIDRVDYNVTVSGDYSMSVTLGGVPIVGSPFSVTVSPQATTIGWRSTATGTGLNSATAGVIGTFWIQSKDVFGNNRTIGVADTFDVQFTGPSSVATTSFDTVNGIDRVDYNVTVSGDYSMSVTYGGVHISGSPFSVTVVAHTVTAQWLTTASGTGLNSATAGVFGTFWIQPRDTYGNNRTIGVTDTFDVQLTGPSTVNTASFDTVNGIDRVDYNVTVSGDYSMAVTLGGVHIVGSPFSVTVSPQATTIGWRSTATGTGLNSATAGVIGTFWIQSKDVFGNNRTIGVADTFDVQFTGPSSVATTSFDTVNGIDRVDYNVTVSGDYSMSVTLGGVHIVGSPFSVTVSPQATTIGWRSTATGTGLNSATAGVIGTFWIQSKDVFGNNRTAGVTDSFDVQLTGPSSVATTSFDRVNGIDRVGYNVTVSGSYSMAVTYGGVHISGSPFSVTVSPQPYTYVPTCTVSGPGLSGSVAGVDVSVYVQARDTFSNNRTVGGDVFTATITTAGAIYVVNSSHVADGISVITYTATYAETYTMVIMADGYPVLGSPFSNIVIVPAQTSAPQSVAWGYGTADHPVNHHVPIYVDARDEFSNQRGQGGDPFIAVVKGPDSVGAGSQPVSLTDAGNGTYTGSYTVTTIGDYWLYISLSSVNVSHSPIKLRAVDKAVIDAITPNLGPRNGDTLISVTGSNYVNMPLLKCRWTFWPNQTVVIDGTYVSASIMQCLSQQQVFETNTTLAVSNDGGIMWSHHEAGYTYVGDASITAVYPDWSPTFGGVSVTITGADFINSEYLSCKFDDTVGHHVVYKSPTSFVCTSPSRTVGFVTVHVSNNGQQYSSTGPSFRYREPFSQHCRLPNTLDGEFPPSQYERQLLGQSYHVNLASDAGTVITTSAVSTVAQRPTLLNDGDLCCENKNNTNGIECGTAFVHNDTHLIHITVQLNRPAFVNEVVSSWNWPCRNEPKEIWIEGLKSNEWKSIARRNLDRYLGPRESCHIIASDASDAAVCPTFFPDFESDMFRMLVNNSEARIGTQTDGLWLYEMGVHGVYTDVPRGLISVSAVHNTSVPSLPSTVLPTVYVMTENYHHERLYANDVHSTTVSMTLLLNGVDVTGLYVSSTLTLNITAGMANYTDITLSSPMAGSYTLKFYTPSGYVVTSLSFNVVPGPAAALRAVMPTSTILSGDEVRLHETLIYTVDHAGNTVGMYEGASHTVNATVSAAVLLDRNLSLATTNGHVYFTLWLYRPVAAIYTVRFSATGLVDALINVTIVPGYVHGLLIGSSVVGPVASAYATLIPAVPVYAYDIAGAATTLTGSSFITLTAVNGTLSGTTTYSFIDGMANITSTNLMSPLIGSYLVAVTSTGLVSTSVTVHVKVGDAVGIVASLQGSSSYPSTASVSIDPIKINAVDAGSNYADGGPLTVTATSNTTTLYGDITATLVNGNVTFGNLILNSPVKGTYWLTFTGLSSVTVSVTVTVGPAVTLDIISPANKTVTSQSLATVYLGHIELGSRDAGGNRVSVGDHNVTVSLNPLTVHGSDVVMSSGNAVVSDLHVNKPTLGNYTLRFSTAGLTSVEMCVMITLGPPHHLMAEVDRGPYPSTALTRIGNMTVSVLDAGGSLVDGNTAARPVTVSLANDTSLIGTTTLTLSNYAVFANVSIAAPSSGTYVIETASTGLIGTTSLVDVSVGPPVSVTVASHGSLTYESVSVVLLDAVTLRLVDTGGNAVDIDTGRSATVTANGTVVGSASMENGNVTIDTLTLTAPKAGIHRLVFDVSGIPNSAVLLMSVTVGPAVTLDIISPANKTVTSQSLATVYLGHIELGSRDAGGNRVSVGDHNVTVSSNPLTVHGSDVVMSSGNAVVSDLHVNKPTLGNYTLRFSTAGLTSVEMCVMITLGPPHHLMAEVDRGPYPSTALTRIGNMTVSVLDAGGSLVDGNNAMRSVTVSLANGTALIGTKTLTLSNYAVFTNLSIVAPSIGTYVVETVSAGVIGTTSLVDVTVGPPSSVVVSSHGSLTYQSVSVVMIEAVTLGLVDAGNNAVLLDTGRSVTVTANGTVIGSGTMVNGNVTIDTLPLSAPKAGIYRLVFDVSGIPNSGVLYVSVSIGPATHMKIVSSQPTAKQSVTTIVLDTVQLTIQDAGDNTIGLGDAVNRVVTATVGGSSVNGYTNATGAVTFDSLVMQSPAVGVYSLCFTSFGLTQLCIDQTIVVGPAHSLKITSAPSLPYPSAVQVTLGTVVVNVLDAGKNLVPVGTHRVIASLINDTSSLVGDVNVTLTNGTVSFLSPSLRMLAPKKGLYILVFSADGLYSAEVHVQITIGMPTGAVLLASDLGIVESDVASAMNNIIVYSQDAGGNLVGSLDTSDRSTFVSIEAADNPGVSIPSLSGNTSTTMTQGVATISGASLVRPVIGTYVLRVQIAGLPSVQATVHVCVGDAESVWATMNSVHTYSSGSSVLLNPITVRLRDAGGNTVVNDVMRTLALSGNGIETTYYNMTNATLTIDTLTTSAVASDYTMSISSVGLLPITLSYRVNHGAPARLSMESTPPDEAQNDVAFTPPIKVKVADGYGNTVNISVDVKVEINAIKDVDPLRYSGETEQTVNGVATFDTFTFVARRGDPYTLTFKIQGVTYSSLPTISHNVTVKSCSNLGRDLVPSGSVGESCSCRAGYVHSDTFVCDACPVDTYQELQGQTVCNICPVRAGTHGKIGRSSKADCQCNAGYYAVSTMHDCAVCVKGGVCNGGYHIEPKPGYWRLSSTSTNFFPCYNNESCLGGLNSTCATGYDGVLCSVCQPGYGKFGSTCSECYAASTNWLLMIFFMIALGMVVVVMVRTATDSKTELQFLIRVMVNYIQVTSFIGDFHVSWPPYLVALFDIVSVALFAFSLHPFTCSFPWLSFYIKFALYMFLPFIVLIAVGIIGLIWYQIRKINRSPAERKKAKTEAVNFVVISTLVIFLLLYPTVTKNAFQIHNCASFDNHRYLVQDLSISCSDPEYLAWMPLGWVLIFAFSLLLPIVTFVLIAKNIKKLKNPDSPVGRRLMFLHDGYTIPWWEGMIMARKVALAAVSVFFRNQITTQLYMGTWILAISLFLHLQFRPFEVKSIQKMETGFLIASIITMFTGYLFYDDTILQEPWNLVAAVFIVLCNVVALAAAVFLISRAVKRLATKEFSRAAAFVAGRLETPAPPPSKKLVEEMTRLRSGSLPGSGTFSPQHSPPDTGGGTGLLAGGAGAALSGFGFNRGQTSPGGSPGATPLAAGRAMPSIQTRFQLPARSPLSARSQTSGASLPQLKALVNAARQRTLPVLPPLQLGPSPFKEESDDSSESDDGKLPSPQSRDEKDERTDERRGSF